MVVNLHRFTIYALFNRHWATGIGMILASLALVSFQAIILINMSVGKQHARCSTHVDCMIGQYCSADFSTHSFYESGRDRRRCDDCASLGQYDYEIDFVKKLLYKNTSGVITDVTNCSDVWGTVPG